MAAGQSAHKLSDIRHSLEKLKFDMRAPMIVLKVAFGAGNIPGSAMAAG